MEDKLVSIIIPLYNGADFIERCVGSVLSQVGVNVNELDIIILNDGSSDDSLGIASRIQESSSVVVRVFSGKNAGVARTRNRGIELAKGKYVMFLDQDDYLDKDYVATFLAAAEAGSCDIVVGGYRRPDESGRVKRTVAQSRGVYSRFYRVSAAWAKIHRTDFLRNNKIEFYSNSFGEDIIFTMQEARLTKNVKAIGYVGYNWFWNTRSVSNTKQKSLSDRASIVELIDSMLRVVDDSLSAYYVVQTGVYYLLHAGRLSSRRDFTDLYHRLVESVNSSNLKSYTGLFFWIGPSGVAPTTRIAVVLFLTLPSLRMVPLFARMYCKFK